MQGGSSRPATQATSPPPSPFYPPYPPPAYPPPLSYPFFPNPNPNPNPVSPYPPPSFSSNPPPPPSSFPNPYPPLSSSPYPQPLPSSSASSCLSQPSCPPPSTTSSPPILYPSLSFSGYPNLVPYPYSSDAYPAPSYPSPPPLHTLDSYLPAPAPPLWRPPESPPSFFASAPPDASFSFPSAPPPPSSSSSSPSPSSSSSSSASPSQQFNIGSPSLDDLSLSPSAPAAPPTYDLGTSYSIMYPPIFEPDSSGDSLHHGIPEQVHSGYPHSVWAPPLASSHSVHHHSSGSLSHHQYDMLVSYSGAEKRSLKYCLLYGSLEVCIHSAINLPNKDMFSEYLRQTLRIGGSQITSDPYVCLILKGSCLARTDVISNNQNPEWNQRFVVNVAHKVAEIEFVVKDNDMVGAQYIGEVKIPAEVIMSRPIIQSSYPLLTPYGSRVNRGAQLTISLSYRPIEQDPLYKFGVGKNHAGVPQTYFPLRRGCRLTLYQDAHVPRGLLPRIDLSDGAFEQRHCWNDIYKAIVDAKHLVYIVGWSIYTEIMLVRGNEPSSTQGNVPKRLGELLKWKASGRHVRVLLLVWDDKTSHSVFGNTGVMGTHDEETRKFFSRSDVVCLLAPRYADSKLSWFKQQVVGTIYSHHQKVVIVDTESPSSNKRRLTAFLGGLDLCNGRYDTPEHTLFSKLQTDFKDDYHNPTFPTKINAGGPRQPWHDLHCKIEGPAVYDVLLNFEQRWKKAAKWHPRLKLHEDRGLLDLKKAAWLEKRDAHIASENDLQKWYIQIFRSIDSGSVKGFPKDAEQVRRQNLVSRKNVAVDMSIQAAYIKAIRSAQHFIYIENQYFIGSSFAWTGYKDAGADNLIPIELALKIVSKIKAHKDFAVYVVIPMWPEGDPVSLSVQEILFFQRKTMEMMYTLIVEALKEEQLDGIRQPTDYLNFFCLGNREPKQRNEPSPAIMPTGCQAKASENRRFMIYVHSKGMIVDDEYVIMGSANINQRSMDGSRDTEIAMGAYQPYYTWAHRGGHPRGQVYGYRMSLWAEHLGVIDGMFCEPWSLGCVRAIQQMSQINWRNFISAEVRKLDGHLLAYPVKIDSSGKVVSLENCEYFPDVGGKILGTSTKLPDNVTS